MAQPLPITFADLPVGLEPLLLFDQQFQASTDGAYLKDDSVPLSALLTGTSGLAVGVAAFLGTPSSGNLAAALTDKTGTGVAVFSDSPTLVTPTISGTNGAQAPLSAALNDSSAVIGNPHTFWNPTYFGNAATGIVHRFNRVLVGEAALGSSDEPMTTPDWLESAIGNTTSNSQLVSVSTLGGLGITGAARTSDHRLWLSSASRGSQGVNGFALNDDTGLGSPIAAAVTALVLHNDGITGISEAAEITAASNASTTVDITPHGKITSNTSFNLNLSSGFTGYTQPVSAAIVVGPSKTGTLYRKGWVSYDNAYDPTVGAGGDGVAAEFAIGQSLRWLNSSNVTDAEIWGSASGLQMQSGPVARAAKITTFTSSGTYTPTAGMTIVRVYACGGGGGGGGGALQVASTAVSGGGGGGGGFCEEVTLSASQIGSSQTVTIGTGGTAGAAATSSTTAGGNGGSGGSTSLGSLFSARGGGGGAGGQLGAASGGGGGAGSGNAGGSATGSSAGSAGALGGGAGGAGGPSNSPTLPGASSGGGGCSATGVAGAANNSLGASGAGAGGGISAANATNSGGTGGTISLNGQNTSGGTGGIANANGAPGAAAVTSAPFGKGGTGGGGGGSGISGTAGNGGAGGGPGGGGGGGGSMTNGGTAGNGGAGAAGQLVVIEYF